MEESMLEDINCLLGSGEVPNLFTPDEEADIVVRVRDAVRVTGHPDTHVSRLDMAILERTSLQSNLTNNIELQIACVPITYSLYDNSSAFCELSIPLVYLCPGEVHGFLHGACTRSPARCALPRPGRSLFPGTGQKFPQPGQLQVTTLRNTAASLYVPYPDIQGRNSTHFLSTLKSRKVRRGPMSIQTTELLSCHYLRSQHNRLVQRLAPNCSALCGPPDSRQARSGPQRASGMWGWAKDGRFPNENIG